MHKISGSILSGIFAVLAALHVYWALGGRRGWAVVLPTQAGSTLLAPTPPMIWAVALALGGALATTLGRMRLWGGWLPLGLFRWGMRVIGVAFLLRAVGDFRTVGVRKTITDTPFARWDTRLFSPLCAVVAVLAALTDAEGVESV